MLSRHSPRHSRGAAAPAGAATAQGGGRAAFPAPSRIAAGAAVLLMALAVAPAAAEKVSLTLAPNPGDTLQYRLQLQQEISSQGMSMTGTEAGTVHITPQASQHDTLQFLIRCSGFESSVKRGDDLTPQKSQLDGITLRALVSRHGEVFDVQPQSTVPGELRQQLQPLVENFFANLADRPIEPGDTWTHEEKVLNKEDAKAEPEIEGKTEYTLDEVTKKKERKVAKILGKGTAKVHVQSGGVDIVGEAKGDSEALVALDSGIIVHLKSTSTFKGSMGTMTGSRVEYFELELQP